MTDENWEDEPIGGELVPPQEEPAEEEDEVEPDA